MLYAINTSHRGNRDQQYRLTSGTLDDALGLRENGLSLALELLDELPRLVGVLVRIDGRDVGLVRVLERTRQSLDASVVCTVSPCARFRERCEMPRDSLILRPGATTR